MLAVTLQSQSTLLMDKYSFPCWTFSSAPSSTDISCNMIQSNL